MAFEDEQILDQLEADIATRLMGDPWFGQSRMLSNGTYVVLPVITEEAGDIDTATEQALAMAGPGICLQVRAMEWDGQYKNVPGPYLEQIDVKLVGLELVPRNRGTKLAPSPTGTLRKLKATMIRAQKLLHLWTPPSLTRALVCGAVKLMTVLDENGNVVKSILGYEAYVRAAGGVGFTNIPQVATPTIAIDGGMITLACATGGACVCYSLDNSNPSPRNGLIYTQPVAVVPGRTVRARAFLEYWTTSAVATAAL
jgi:hypothetical protein